MLNLTFVGPGTIGLPIAVRLASAIQQVSAVDPDSRSRERARAAGLHAVSRIAEAPHADVVLVMVATPEQLADVVTEALRGDITGQRWVVMSTVGPDAMREQAVRLEAAGARVVDAPVTGGVARAQTGDLTVFAAGAHADVEAVTALFEPLATTHLVGDSPGEGQAIKVVNQHLCSVHIVAAAEALSLAESLGLDRQRTLSLVERGSAASWMLSDRGPRMAQDNDVQVTSSIGIFVKDSGIVADAARAVNADTPLLDIAGDRYRQAAASGLSTSDDSRVIETYAPEERSGGECMTTVDDRRTELAERTKAVRAAAHRMRHHMVDMGEVQGQGYVGQALGVADVLACAYVDQLRYRGDDPHWEHRDRFLLSTGHYAIALYAALAEAGVLPAEELLTYGSDGSRLPMSGMASYTPGMEVSGGSLGHGLTVAVGMALGLRHRGLDARVFNFLSDGELNEGSTWEAAMSAAHHELGHLTALVDMNALQADGRTDSVLRIEPVTDKWVAAGWFAQRVDGNDPIALLRAFDAVSEQAHRRARPSVILCDTRIGSGVPLLEQREKAHFMRIEEHEWELCRKQLAEGGHP